MKVHVVEVHVVEVHVVEVTSKAATCNTCLLTPVGVTRLRRDVARAQWRVEGTVGLVKKR